MKIQMKMAMLAFACCMGVSQAQSLSVDTGGTSADTSMVSKEAKAAKAKELKAMTIGGNVVGGRSAMIVPTTWHVPDDQIKKDQVQSAVVSFVVNQPFSPAPSAPPGDPQWNPSIAYRLNSFLEEDLMQTNAIGMWVRLMAGTNETVSLDNMSGEFDSDDLHHYLSETNTFPLGTTYSLGARVKQGNQWISSGPASQEGSDVIVGFGSKRFNNTLAEIRSYGYLHPNWTVVFTVRYKGAVVATYTLKKGTPFQVYNQGGSRVFYLWDYQNPNTYTLQAAESLDGTVVWQDIGTLSRFSGVTNNWTNLMGFFRIKK